MRLVMNILFLFMGIFVTGTAWCGLEAPAVLQPPFHSFAGDEAWVSFDHIYITDFRKTDDIKIMTAEDRRNFVNNNIKPTLKYLFGPATHRYIGGPQRNDEIVVDWEGSFLLNAKIVLPIHYRAQWILRKDVVAAGEFSLPVPVNSNVLFSESWKNCSDSNPEHQYASVFWYYWDPDRIGCDHREDVQFKNVLIQVGEKTQNQSATYPEYGRMMRVQGSDKTLNLTFAFGYVNDDINPSPDSDSDPGAREYQKFVNYVRGALTQFHERQILQREYGGTSQPQLPIGHRFSGKINGIDVNVNVIAAAGVDQMLIFAHSFAHDHDGFFGWFGHSRVGGGFDADRFRFILERNPNYFSITSGYQLVYWGGCNSYSYYTLPFFQMKSKSANGNDPNGTKNLDIVAHGLPSLFILNAENAAVMFSALIQFHRPTSYQTLIRQIEENSNAYGRTLLAGVLGDEDN